MRLSARAGDLVARLSLLVAIVNALIARPSVAHEALPLVIELEQIEAARFEARLRAPANVAPHRLPGVSLGRSCEIEPRAPRVGTRYRCTGQRPGTLYLSWPGDPPAGALFLRVRESQTSFLTAVASPGATEIPIPWRKTSAATLWRYCVLGIEHILLGLDHLLFLGCLLALVAWRVRAVAWVVSGFTVGHATTISLASLDVLPAHGAAVEVLIALSIAFLAAEVFRGRADTLTARYPACMATLFGLLHGLGFAGALASAGLPREAVAPALVGFNLGVEAGQLTVVACAIVFTRLLCAGLPGRSAARVGRFAVLLIGVTAGTWVWQGLFDALLPA